MKPFVLSSNIFGSANNISMFTRIYHRILSESQFPQMSAKNKQLNIMYSRGNSTQLILKSIFHLLYKNFNDL